MCAVHVKGKRGPRISGWWNLRFFFYWPWLKCLFKLIYWLYVWSSVHRGWACLRFSFFLCNKASGVTKQLDTAEDTGYSLGSHSQPEPPFTKYLQEYQLNHIFRATWTKTLLARPSDGDGEGKEVYPIDWQTSAWIITFSFPCCLRSFFKMCSPSEISSMNWRRGPDTQ